MAIQWEIIDWDLLALVQRLGCYYSPEYLVQLGDLSSVTPEIVENLFTRDLAYLREFYNRINQQGNAEISTQCPRCNHNFNVELALAGE